jgi:serine/threonine-protein kinase
LTNGRTRRWNLNKELWARVEQALDRILDLERPAWPAAVAEVCAGDPEVRREVEAMLESYTAAERAFDPAAMAEALAAEGQAVRRATFGTEWRASLETALANQYVLQREIGAGGMAIVFRAHDRRHRRDVAIKVLRPELARTLGDDHFLREIEIAAGLTHPHIVPLYDSGRAGDFLYYVMPFVEGESLRARLQRETQLGLDEALRITREVADALSYAHDRGIVHRDIKPENILFEGGHAVVSDFGIARAINAAGGSRLTQTGMVLGTPIYMSPEQAVGETTVDARTDVYALGCVLYELLAGDPPFTGSNPQAMLARKLMGVVPDLAVVRERVPAGIERAIHRALARVPAERFGTAAEFVTSLGDGSPPRRDTKRRRPFWLAGATVVLALAALMVVRLLQPDAPPNSLAVLNFDNLSPDTADAYLADGLAEEISSRLGDVGRLQVKSRQAVQRFRGTAAGDLPSALGVGYLVEGSVRRAGDRVRTSIHLVDARTGFRVWGEDYDRATRDLLSLQEEIARDVAIQIAGRLLPAERALLAARPTDHPEAYDRFLRGNYYLTQRTPGAVARAIAEHEAAADLDPTFTSALARAAYGYALYLEWGWEYPGLPPDSLLARGFEASEAALAHDSAAADAWMAHGYMLVHRHPRTLAGVADAFARAFALDSANAEAWHQYGWIAYLSGEDSTAIDAYQQALRLEPERPFTLVLMAAVPFYEHRFGEALPWLDSALTVDPTFSFGYVVRALARLHAGDSAGARTDARAARRHAEDSVYAEAAITIVQAGLGDPTRARPVVQQLGAGALERVSLPVEEGVFVAAALTAVGDHDRALQVLERSQPRGAHLLKDLQLADLDPLRSDPRFQRIIAESGLPQGAR